MLRKFIIVSSQTCFNEREGVVLPTDLRKVGPVASFMACEVN